jgi:hypothetical protein
MTVTEPERIEAYLGRVAAALSGPARPRADIIAELRGVLLDSVDAYTAAGMPPMKAVRSAIDELGEPDDVAASYRPELTVKQARKLAVVLVIVGGLIGGLWAHAAQMSDKAVHGAPLWHLLGAPPVPIAAAAFLLTLTTGLMTIGATGRLTRWTSDRPRTAAITAAVGGIGSAATDLVILAILAVQVVARPHSLSPLPVTVAALASSARFVFARRAAHRCMACPLHRGPQSLHLLSR